MGVRSPKHVYSVRLNGRHVKKLTASSMETIYGQFNRYAKSKGYCVRVVNARYAGMLAWRNIEGHILDIVKVKQ